jgi:hypothetical protein
MQLNIDDELTRLCQSIVVDSTGVSDWSLHESCDAYQSDRYCGGYEAAEEAFCFSYYSSDGTEYWFQLTLDEVSGIARGSDETDISLREAV